MAKQNTFILDIYFTVLVILSIRNLYAFFSPESYIFLYHDFLKAFDSRYVPGYWLNLFALIMNILACAPVYLYAHRIKLFPAWVWQVFVCLWGVSNVVGRPFEGYVFKAAIYAGWDVLALMIAHLAALYIPLIIINTRYAFGHERKNA